MTFLKPVIRHLGHVTNCPKCGRPGNLFTRITPTTSTMMGPYFYVQHHRKIYDAAKYRRRKQELKKTSSFVHQHCSVDKSKLSGTCWLGRILPPNTRVLHPDRLFTESSMLLIQRETLAKVESP